MSCGGAAPVDQYVTTYSTEVKSLNYFLLLDNTALRVSANTQDGLVENDRLGRYVPSLAEKWEHNEDFTEWTFTLREGLSWTDSKGGKAPYALDAADFVAGMKYVADPKNGIKNVGIIRKLIVGLNDYFYDLADVDDGAKTDVTRDEVTAGFEGRVGVLAKDERTVTYRLTAPTPYFLSYLVTELFFPIDAAFLAEVGEDFATSKERILYSGAYYMSDWQRDKQIVMTKNELYWDKDAVKVRKVVMQKVADPAITIQMFQRGELATASVQADQVKALRGGEWGKYVYLSEKSSVTFWFFMNFTSSNPEFKAFANNLDFRKALYYGIDRVKLIELQNPTGPEKLLRNTIIPEDTLFDEEGRDYTDYPSLADLKAGDRYDPVKAKEHFAKAVAALVGPDGTITGVEGGKVSWLPIAEFEVDGKLPLQMVYVHGTGSVETKEALLLAAMLEETFGPENIDVILGQYVDDKFVEAVEPRRFDLAYDSFSFKYADPMAQFGRLVTDGSINDGQYSDPEFDALVEEANSRNVIRARYELFARAERMMIDRCYLLPWQSGGGQYVMSKVVPFTYPRGGFGVTRFKYKGMVVEREPISAERYAEYEAAFRAELAASAGQ
jgi:oligopeptide transport system substrate-binding protein